MARTVRNDRLLSRTSRLGLAIRREPHWTVLTTGCALGYRRAKSGGTWVARFRDDAGKQHYKALGPTDDVLDADDSNVVLAHATARERADEWFSIIKRELAGEEAPKPPCTVRDVVDEYLEWYAVHKKSVDRARFAAVASIYPELGDIKVNALRTSQIDAWLTKMSKTPARIRTRSGADQQYRNFDNSEDATRRRKSTANRVFTVLRAALNKAYRDEEKGIDTDRAWKRVKPFKGVDAARIRYLSDNESRRLVNACNQTFRPMVIAALMTGARYSELTGLKAIDFERDSSTIHVPFSKGGKGRHIALTDEGAAFFERMTAGKADDSLIFSNTQGGRWGRAEQRRPMENACKAANIEPSIGFHGLRHTYASRLIMRGVPSAVIADQLGHSSTRMVEKHYGHLSSSYVAETIRASFGTLRVFESDNVAVL